MSTWECKILYFWRLNSSNVLISLEMNFLNAISHISSSKSYFSASWRKSSSGVEISSELLFIFEESTSKPKMSVVCFSFSSSFLRIVIISSFSIKILYFWLETKNYTCFRIKCWKTVFFIKRASFYIYSIFFAIITHVIF